MISEGATRRLARIRAQGRIPAGIFVGSTDPSVTEIVALAGYDFAVIDCEHAPLDPYHAVNHIRAAEARDILAWVRVPSASQPEIQRFLDIGCDGLIVPRIESAADAARVVAATQFPPSGVRGSCAVVRAASYSTEDWPAFRRQSAETVMVVPLLETRAGIDAADEILDLTGVEMVMFGPVDLASDLGVATDGPELRAAWERVQTAAERAGKLVMALPMGGADHRAVGALILGMDLRILRDAAAMRLQSSSV